MSARDYLYKLQRGAMGSRPGSAYDEHILARYADTLSKWDPARRRLMEENLERGRAYYARYKALLPTPLQSVQDYARLIEAKVAIDRELERVGKLEPRSNVVFGSLETASLNAESAYLSSSDEYLVVFNRGLLLLMLLTANLAAVALFFDPKTMSDRIHEELLDHLAPEYGKLLAAVYDGEAPPLEQAIPLFYIPEKEKRWTGLEDGAFDFVVAHEYSHILRDHLVHAKESISEDCGGWGAEYEADSLAMDLAAQACAARHEGNPAALALTMQGICVFFAVICHIEQYGAEVRGDPAYIWSVSKHHPPTYVRWRRMIDTVRSRVQEWQWPFYSAQMQAIDHCLQHLYARGPAEPADGRNRSPAQIEWRFQRVTWETMAEHRLVPQHLYIALRCTQAALQAGAPLDDTGFGITAARADSDMMAAGARPLRSYVDLLPAIARKISTRALSDAQFVTPAVIGEIVERLMEVVLLDARTRYELPPTPTIEEVSAAGRAIHLLDREAFKKRRSREAGDNLVAFFLILAEKLFPQDTEPNAVKRVELMLSAYFLRGDLDRTLVEPPSEDRAREVIKPLAAMNSQALIARISEEVGEAGLTLFRALSDAAMPGESMDSVAQNVRLMMIAYLARADLRRLSPAESQIRR